MTDKGRAEISRFCVLDSKSWPNYVKTKTFSIVTNAYNFVFNNLICF